MLNMIYQGLIKACFSHRSGVIGWVAQGLTKVLPQPDEKYRETNNGDNEEHTEVRCKGLYSCLLSLYKLL